MKPPSSKEAVLAYLRCVRARAQLAMAEVDFLGIAVKDDLMSPSSAQAFIELYGLDYMQLATIEAQRQSYFSGEEAELAALLDSEEREANTNPGEREPLRRTP